MRVEAELVHHLLIVLVHQAMEAAGPRGRVRVRASEGTGRVVLHLDDDGPPLELAEEDGTPLRRGRPLGVRLGAELLRRTGGSLGVVRRLRGNSVELRLPRVRRRV